MSGKQKHTDCLLRCGFAQIASERLFYLLVAYGLWVFVRRCCKHGPGKRTLKLDIAIVAMHSFVPQEFKGRIDPEYTDQRFFQVESRLIYGTVRHR